MSSVPDKVDVYIPDLGLGKVPRSELEDALKSGGKVVEPPDAEVLRAGDKVWGFDADGNRGRVPFKDLEAAKKDGFFVASYEQAIQAAKEQRIAADNADAVKDPAVQKQLELFTKPTPVAHGPETNPKNTRFLRPESSLQDQVAAQAAGGEGMSQYFDSEAWQAQKAENDRLAAEHKFYDENRNTEAALQGVSRLAGGDYLRRLFNAGETAAQEYLGLNPKYDIFQPDSEVVKNKEYNPILATTAELGGAIVTGQLLRNGISAGVGYTGLKTADITGAVARTAAPQIVKSGAKTAIKALANAPAEVKGAAFGAAEGAAWSAYETVNDAFLHGEYDQLGEKVLAGMKVAGVMGGVFGGAFAPGTKYGPKNVIVTDGRALPPQTPMVAPLEHGADNLLDDGIGRMSKINRFMQAHGADPETAQVIKQDLHRELRSNLNDIERSSSKIDGLAGIAAKRAHLAKNYTDVVTYKSNKLEVPPPPTESVMPPGSSTYTGAVAQDGLVPRFDGLPQPNTPELSNSLLKGLDGPILPPKLPTLDRITPVAPQMAPIETGLAKTLKPTMGNTVDVPYRTGSEAVHWARREAGLAADDLDTLFEHGASAGKGGRSVVAVLKEQLDGVEQDIFREADNPSKGVVYSVLDQQKRLLGSAAESAKNQYVKLALRAKYEKIRLYLEDGDVWGKSLAEEQKKINALWAESIGWAKHDSLKKATMKGAETSSEDLFVKLPIADDGFIAKLRDGLGKAEHETMESAMVNRLKFRAADAKMRAEIWGSDILRQEAKDLENQTNNALKGLAMMKRINNTVKPAGSGVTSTLSLTGAGSLLGGMATEGGMAAVLANPGAALTGAAVGYGLKKGLNYAKQKYTKSIFPTVKSALDVQEKLQKLNYGTLLNPKRINKSGPWKPGYDYIMRNEPILNLGDEKLKPLQDWVTDLFSDDENAGPQSMINAVQDETPELLPAFAAGLQRQRDFLAAKLEDPTVKPEQAMAYTQAVADPGSIIDMIADGAQSPEHMEALASVYPTIHSEIMQTLEPKINALPFQEQMIARVKLGLPATPPEKLRQLQAVALGGAALEEINKSQDQVLTQGNQRAPKMEGLV